MKPGDPDLRIPRRTFVAGTAAAALGAFGGWSGCARRGTPMEGTIVGPSMAVGHRLREGRPPSPSRWDRADVVIVGGGIAGLAAARELAREFRGNVVLVELESDLGGNSSWGQATASAYPWGAHYVPLPGREAPEVVALFEELGVITGQDSSGRPIYREQYLCHDPHERLFLHGRWQEGLIPQLGVSADDRAEADRFLARMQTLRESTGTDGRPLFAIPVDRSSADPAWRGLDLETFSTWLDREGFRARPLRWYLDYCCRDDFGLGTSGVSAWAGLHYFAARGGEAANASSSTVVTWPHGNGWLVERLRERIRATVRRGCLVHAVREEGGRVRVEGMDAKTGEAVGWDAGRVILAVPQFIAARMLGEAGGGRGTGAVYPPWLVANLSVDRLPTGRGMEAAWDNVLYEGRGLGYVIANHQEVQSVVRESVLTYYLPLDHAAPTEARREASTWTWEQARDVVLADLRRAHPDIADVTRRMDIRIWGHGMICPVPGFLWSGRRTDWARPVGRIDFAHSDLSGMSLFEEAYIRGVEAGRRVLT